MLTPPEGQRVAATVSSDSGGGQKPGMGQTLTPLLTKGFPTRTCRFPLKSMTVWSSQKFCKVVANCLHS